MYGIHLECTPRKILDEYEKVGLHVNLSEIKRLCVGTETSDLSVTRELKFVTPVRTWELVLMGETKKKSTVFDRIRKYSNVTFIIQLLKCIVMHGGVTCR